MEKRVKRESSLKSSKSKKAARIEKKAQIMGMPFQFIFSLILIAVFIFAAVIVTKVFLSTADHARIISFEKDLADLIERTWTTTLGTKTSNFNLPDSIKYICFTGGIGEWGKNKPDELVYWEISRYKNDSKAQNANFFFYPTNVLEGYGLSPYMDIKCGKNKKECLDLSEIDNPYCIKNSRKLNITFVKEIGKDVRIKE